MSYQNPKFVASQSIPSNFPVTFTPTDAARLSKSYLDTDEDENTVEENKPLLPKRSSRQPLMHHQWYTSSPKHNSGVDFSFGSKDGLNGTKSETIKPCMSNHDLHSLSATLHRHKYYRKLVHPLDNRMSIPDHVLPSSLFYVIPTKRGGKQSSIVSIFAIWNTMMGTSLLAIPWGFEQSGFTLGVLLLIFMGALTFYTAFRVLQSKDFVEGDVFEFSDVCRYYLGRWGEWIAITFALITFIGGMVVYWVLMSNFLYTGGIFIYDSITHRQHSDNTTNTHHNVLCPNGHFHPHGNHSGNHSYLHFVKLPSEETEHFSAWSLNFSVPLYLSVILFPLLNFKSPTIFTKFNSLGTASVLFIISFVVTKASKWGWNYEFTLHQNSESYQSPDFRYSFTALTGLLSLAFFLHNAVITILKSNKRPENNVRDLSLGYLLVTLTYLIVGVFFYLSFPLPKACISSNFLNNLHSSDVYASIARLLLLFQTITVYPLLAYMLRVNALYALCKSVWPGLWQVLLLNTVLVLVCVLVAMFYPHIGDLIRYSGALSGMVYIFFLPSVIYILYKKSSASLSHGTLIIHILIIIFGAINFISQFIISPSK